MQEHKEDNKIILHACCGICSGYPVSFLKDAGYSVSVYFYNPNIYPDTEYQKRLEAEKTLCRHFGVELIEEIILRKNSTNPQKDLKTNRKG